MRIGALELVLILVIILFLGGWKVIPKLTESITNSAKMFKKSSKEQVSEETTRTDN